MTTDSASIGRTVRRLALVGLAMFGFGFALVPIYDIICEATGLNGKTSGPYVYKEAAASVDKERQVKVSFLADVASGMPWEFRPAQGAVSVHPGELVEAWYLVRNPTDQVMTGQAVPSVAPGRAAPYFHKTECFCFERQSLEPGEELRMPLRFIVDRDTPKSVASIHLSYTMFDVTAAVAASN